KTQHGRARRDMGGRAKALIEAFSTYDIEGPPAHAGGARGEQAQRRAIWQFLAFENRGRRSDGRWDRRLGVSEFRLPLIRRQNRTLVVHQFEEVQMLLAGQVASFADVTAGVRRAAVNLERDALHGFAGGCGFYLADDF